PTSLPHCCVHHPVLHSFPTRRSSDLIRSAIRSVATVDELVDKVATKRYTKARIRRILAYILVGAVEKPLPEAVHVLGFTEKGQKDRKSTRLNSSHVSISYAVFCLKKK